MTTAFLVKLPEEFRRRIMDTDGTVELEDSPQCTIVFGNKGDSYEELLNKLETSDARDSPVWDNHASVTGGDRFVECPSKEYVEYIANSEVMQRHPVEVYENVNDFGLRCISGSIWCGQIGKETTKGGWGVITGPSDPWWYGENGAETFWHNVKNDCNALDS
jgi:hypothetical protein